MGKLKIIFNLLIVCAFKKRNKISKLHLFFIFKVIFLKLISSRDIYFEFSPQNLKSRGFNYDHILAIWHRQVHHCMFVVDQVFNYEIVLYNEWNMNNIALTYRSYLHYKGRYGSCLTLREKFCEMTGTKCMPLDFADNNKNRLTD